jgi:hypothetical protein
MSYQQHPGPPNYPSPHNGQSIPHQQRTPRAPGFGWSISALVVGLVGTSVAVISLAFALLFAGLILVFGAPAEVREEIIAGGTQVAVSCGVPLGIAGVVLAIIALALSRRATGAAQATASDPGYFSGDQIRQRAVRSRAVSGLVFGAIPLLLSVLIVIVWLVLTIQ